MSRLITSFSLIVTLLAGCASPRKTGRAEFDREWFWMPVSQYDALFREHVPDAPQFAQSMAVIASDSNNKRDTRCSSVFALFENFIRSGCDAKNMAHTLGEATWFHGADLRRAGGVGGQLPIYNGGEDEDVFWLSVLPDEQGQSDWHIFFTLSRPSKHVVDDEDAQRFIRGTLPNEKIRLREFVLCYPDGTMRRFTKQKVWLLWNETEMLFRRNGLLR